MAAITITLSDDPEKRARVIDALCAHGGGYKAKIEAPDGSMIDNPQNKAAFAKDVVRAFVKDVVRAHERDAARRVVDAMPDPDLT